MHTKFRMRTGVAALAAAAALLGSVALSTGIAEAGPLDVSSGSLALTPASGNSSTNFALGIPSGAACPGDSSGGWLWGAFVAPSSANIGSLSFGASGLVVTPAGQDPALYRNLRIGGAPVANQSPNLVDGLINPSTLNSVNLTGAVLTPGTYNLVVACRNDGTTAVAGSSPLQVSRFWTAPITVATLAGAGVNNYTYAFGAPPAAPVLAAATYSPSGATRPTTATVTFPAVVATPAVTGYTATVTQTAGPARPIGPIAIPAGASPSFQIPGLVAGETYTATVTATNTAGTSAVSNTVTVTGDIVAPAPSPINAPNPFVDSAFTVTWGAPSPAPASYNVAITGAGIPAGYVSSFTGLTTLSQEFAAGLPAGSFTVTVTPVYAGGSGITGTPGISTFSVVPGALVFQELTVNRPKGALILTQRCGTYNAMGTLSVGGAEMPNDFPGFPFNLDPAPAVGQFGTAPILVDQSNNPIDGDLVTPGIQTVPDPAFANYPLGVDNVLSGSDIPVGNVTRCGLDLGVAKFVTEFNSPRTRTPADAFPVSPLAGEFFAADGRLNEVTVLDTRDIDAGWKLRGDIEDRFTSIANGDSFSGDYLGILPQMTDDSDLVGGEAPGADPATPVVPVPGSPNNVRPGALYDQTVKAGPQTGSPEATGARATLGVPDGRVLPGDGFPANAAFPNIGAVGMTDNPVLASAPAGRGLGIATIDARLLLLIPASVDAADYAATLTLTVS